MNQNLLYEKASKVENINPNKPYHLNNVPYLTYYQTYYQTV